MSNANFIQVVESSTTGVVGSLPRDIVCVTRETITGFTPDSITGLIKITEAEVETFEAANPLAYGSIQFLTTAFAGSSKPNEVYILPTGGVELTSAMLTKANYSPRAWSFLTIASATLGLSDSATYLADCVTASNWTTMSGKVFFMAFAMEDGGTLPDQLILGGALTLNQRTITCVTNAYNAVSEYDIAYYNPILAALCWVLYSGSIARSIGSLSDAHDFPGVAADIYSATTRAYIAANSLAQYNGAKDQGGSAFLYDTNMNSSVNPPTTPQLENIIAEDYISDYVPIYVRNSLQAAGQTGVPADMAGVMQLYALTNFALDILWKAGAILTNTDGTPNYSLVVLSQSGITALNAAWQTSGVIPVGSIVGKIKAFRAIHYATIEFNYQ